MAKKATAKPVAETKNPNAEAATEEKPKSRSGVRKPIVRVDHPSLIGPEGEDGKPTRLKLTEVPEDFDSRTHKALKKTDFETDGAFFRMRAAQCQANADKFMKEAELSDKLGSRKDRAKVKKLEAMQSKMEELKKQLAEAGVDIESLVGDNE